jgi:hypothetical protein
MKEEKEERKDDDKIDLEKVKEMERMWLKDTGSN